MKKLMVAAAVAMLGIVANAASCDWSAYPVNQYGTSTAADGYKMWFIDSSVSVGDFIDACESASALTTFLSNNGVAASSDSFYGMGSGSTADTYSAGATVTGYLVILDGAIANGAHAFASETASGDIGAQGQSGTIAFGSTQLANMSSKESWETVGAPEPTSGLLLLIGMAGLALKRKRA